MVSVLRVLSRSREVGFVITEVFDGLGLLHVFLVVGVSVFVMVVTEVLLFVVVLLSVSAKVLSFD